jgi:Flp pilus assembly protein TadB
VVITEAEASPQAQLRSRQIKYAVMMGIRALCLLVAALVVGLDAPLAPLWVGICLVGMVALPWMAVLIANDRPPKKASRFSSRLRREEREPPALPASPESRIVDQ